MKKHLFTLIGIVSFMSVVAQSPEIEAWMMNTTGHMGYYEYYPGPPPTTTAVQMTDSTDVKTVCYNTTHIYVRANGLASYNMGPWSGNPNTPSSQDYTFEITRTPTEETGIQTSTPFGGAQGVAINGAIMFGYGDGKSYSSTTGANENNGDGNWDADAWISEGSTMDANGGGHPTGAGKYHYHATPFTLYTDPNTGHSVIIGYSFDGYPIYGPYGYTTATDNTSGVTRMVSSYALRSITDRTILPDGSTSVPAGPAVTSGGSFDLGVYIQDYEYVTSSGTLDEHNGRYCVTPEYPGGTYAYFLSTDSNGDPQFPYILGGSYYGVLSNSDLNNAGSATSPTGLTCYSASSCATTVTVSSQSNPTCNGGTDGSITISTTGFTSPSYAWSSGGTALTESGLGAGSYVVTVTDGSCTDALTITLTEPAAVTYTATSNPATCGASDGDITLAAGGGNGGPYQYNFNNVGFQASGLFSGLAAGLYPMAIQDVAGCLLTGPESVGNAGGAVIGSETPSNVTTCGGSDGSITITVTGGSGTYTFSTDGGANFTAGTSPYSVSVSAGSYSLVVDDGNCETAGSTLTITEPAAPTAPSISGANSYCDGATITDLTATGAGGTFTWYDDVALTSIVGNTNTFTPAGTIGSTTYYVTETSGTCEGASASETVTVTTAPTVNGGSDQTVCENSSVILSGSGATTYTWNNSVIDGTSFTVSATATYTVTGTTNGCSGTDIVVVNVNLLPTVTMDQISVGPMCDDASAVTLVGTPSGGTFSGTGVTGSSFDPATAGISLHTITYSYTDGNGCTNTATEDVGVADCTGIGESETSLIKLYPNPFSDVLNVNYNNEQLSNLTIYDVTGRIVLQTKDAVNQIDASSFTKGVYYIHFTSTSNRVQIEKLIKN